ncbi:hypothetical protein [Rhizobium herbae]
MTELDALYKNAGAFTMFEKLTQGTAVYFNRAFHGDTGLWWSGPWKSQDDAEQASSVMLYKRVQTKFRVKVAKRSKERVHFGLPRP